MDDLKQLVARAQARDVEAYGVIVRRFQDMAYGYGYSLLGDFHLAQDAAQEAFMEAYDFLPKLRDPAAFPGWFRRIVFKHCDRLTRGKRVPMAALDAAIDAVSANPDPARTIEANEIRSKVLEAIQALPERERTATALFYINGYSQHEVAAFLDVPVSTVKDRLYSARTRLKKRMMNMIKDTMKSKPLPGDFADVIVRRAASAQDLKAAAGLLRWSAKHRPQDFNSMKGAEKAGIYIVGREGEVESAGYFSEEQLNIGSTTLRTARPGEMGGESEAVPDTAFVKGYRACFKLAKERGIHLAVAHGSQYDHAFCGFVPCFYYPLVTLPTEKAGTIVSRAKISKATRQQERAAEQALRVDPHGPKVVTYINSGPGALHVIKQDGAVVGYARVHDPTVVRDNPNRTPFGHVTDIVVRTWDAALAVIRIAGELADKVGDERICLMYSHQALITQAILAQGGSYALRGPCDLVGLDAEMAAIIDLVGLTRDLEAEFQSRFRQSAAQNIQAAFSIEMNGETAAFAAKRGRLNVDAERHRVHRLLPRWIMTRLYMGYYSGADVLAMGPIPWDRSDGKTPDDPKLDNRVLELPGPERVLFAALFPKLWPVSWPDPDVWPWLIGKDHPRYQHEESKTAEMKAKIDALRFPWIGY